MENGFGNGEVVGLKREGGGSECLEVRSAVNRKKRIMNEKRF